LYFRKPTAGTVTPPVREDILVFSASFEINITSKNYQLNDAKESSRLYLIRHLVNFRVVLIL